MPHWEEPKVMLDDEAVLYWLIGMTTYIVNEHHRLKTATKAPETNAAPRFHEKNVYEAYEEGFARWMGFRGKEAQEQEINSKKGKS